MKESFEKLNTPEERENREDIILEVYLQRHGPKLSATGEKNETAPYFDTSVEEGFEEMDIKDGKGLVHISSSPVKRAMETAKIELDKISATEHRHKEKVGKQKKLEVPFQPSGEAKKEQHARDLEIIIEMQADLEPIIRDKVEHEHPNLSPEEKEAEVRNLIDMQVLNVVFDQKKAKKRGLQTSYEELADNLAKRYSGFLKHIGLLASKKEDGNIQPENESYKQIDISHSFPIMSLLKKYLVFDDGTSAEELKPQEFFDKIGGVIKESQSLKLDYKKEGEDYVVRVEGNFGREPFSGQLNFKQYEQTI